MNKELQDRLYNKTKNDLTFDDKRYIKALTSLKGRKMNLALFSSLFSLIFLAMGSVIFIPDFDIIGKIFGSIFGLTGLSAVVYSSISHSNSMYKDLGLTKKEYKQLKKSGRIKELSKLVDNINSEDLRNLNIVSNHIEYYENKIERAKQYRESLFGNMIANNQITQEEVNGYLKKEKSVTDEEINKEEDINMLNQ